MKFFLLFFFTFKFVKFMSFDILQYRIVIPFYKGKNNKKQEEILFVSCETSASNERILK